MPKGLNLPQFKCHKVVNAAKITEIGEDGTLVFGDVREVNGATLTEGALMTFRPLPGWLNRHHPEVGGFFVIYNEGTEREYTSYSPGDVFVDGYAPVVTGAALGDTS